MVTVVGFILVTLAICAVPATLVVAIIHYDRIFVWIMKQNDLRLFPEAVGIATMIYQSPEQWTARSDELYQRDIGLIHTGHGVGHITVRTDFGTWKPNSIERRIIWDAVRWRLHRYLKNRIEIALRTTKTAINPAARELQTRD